MLRPSLNLAIFRLHLQKTRHTHKHIINHLSFGQSSAAVLLLRSKRSIELDKSMNDMFDVNTSFFFFFHSERTKGERKQMKGIYTVKLKAHNQTAHFCCIFVVSSSLHSYMCWFFFHFEL